MPVIINVVIPFLDVYDVCRLAGNVLFKLNLSVSKFKHAVLSHEFKCISAEDAVWKRLVLSTSEMCVKQPIFDSSDMAS